MSVGSAAAGTAIDLLLADSQHPQVALLQGDGLGAFVTAQILQLTAAVGGLADVQTADIDGDGALDAVTSNPGSNRIIVVFGDGNYGLREGPSSSAGTAPGALVVGDVDGDGKADVVVADSTDILILRGSGDGSFLPLSRVPIGNRATALVLRDVTGDGQLDVLAVVPNQNAFRVYAGDGTGAFAPGSTSTSNAPSAFTLSDCDGDGHVDVVLANAGDQTLALLRGSGKAFGDARTVATGLAVTRLIATDVNGDGRTDLVGLDGTTGTLHLLLGNGNGTFDEIPPRSLDGPAVGLAVADFNGDRLPDIVVTAPAMQQLVIGSNISPVQVRPGDLDRNGRITVADLTQLLAEFFDGDDADPMSAAGGSVSSGAEADVNGDGSIGAADVVALLQRRVAAN